MATQVYSEVTKCHSAVVTGRHEAAESCRETVTADQLSETLKVSQQSGVAADGDISHLKQPQLLQLPQFGQIVGGLVRNLKGRINIRLSLAVRRSGCLTSEVLISRAVRRGQKTEMFWVISVSTSERASEVRPGRNMRLLP